MRSHVFRSLSINSLFSPCRYPTHSLLRFLLVSNSLDLVLDVILELWSAVVGEMFAVSCSHPVNRFYVSGFVPAYALKEILSALINDDAEAKRTAYFWALVTFIAHLSFAQVDLFQSWHTRRCYERTRGQLFCSIHYKSLKRQDVSGGIGQEEDEHTSADLGKIVNLMQSVIFSDETSDSIPLDFHLEVTPMLFLRDFGSFRVSLRRQFASELLLHFYISM